MEDFVEDKLGLCPLPVTTKFSRCSLKTTFFTHFLLVAIGQRQLSGRGKKEYSERNGNFVAIWLQQGKKKNSEVYSKSYFVIFLIYKEQTMEEITSRRRKNQLKEDMSINCFHPKTNYIHLKH